MLTIEYEMNINYHFEILQAWNKGFMKWVVIVIQIRERKPFQKKRKKQNAVKTFVGENGRYLKTLIPWKKKKQSRSSKSGMELNESRYWADLMKPYQSFKNWLGILRIE